MFLTVHLSQDQSKLSRYVSNTLLDEIETTLKSWEKVLLYLNKRWAFNSLVCKDCQHLWDCPNCDTSLSIHSNPAHLLCHLCTTRYDLPHSCSNCNGTNLLSIWVGTQQIEQVLSSHFSKEKIYRFDSDSMKNISSKKQALLSLENADIVIGTKMITTGFNFEKIGLIGIILVEQELAYPSYDAEEKAYSNLKQLVGRGNRKNQETKIIFQTFIPKNPVLLRLTNNNFKDFFSETLKERKDFLYPPYREMVTLEYRNKDEKKALIFMQKLEQKLKQYNPHGKYQILCWSTAFKKNNSYHVSCILKWKNIRVLLQEVESTILRESWLSVIYH